MDKLSTKDNRKSKREKVLDLLEKHRPLLKKIGATDSKFIPKMAYPDNGEIVIGFYPSEVNGGQDVFTEFVSRDYEPEDPERRLFKWVFNPEYETEYAKTEPHPTTGDRRYLIPIDELIDVAEVYHQEKAEPEEGQQKLSLDLKDAPDANSDQPYSQMSIRDHAAIQWKKPVSHKKWLNELIIKQFE